MRPTAALEWSLLSVLLILLNSLIHGVQNSEVVLGVLEVALCHHAVAAARRIAAELKIFFKKLLSSAADAHIGAIAVEDMVSVERYTATGMMADAAPAPASTAPVIASAHAFHIHQCAVALSCLSALACGFSGYATAPLGKARGPSFDPSTLVGRMPRPSILPVKPDRT